MLNSGRPGEVDDPGEEPESDDPLYENPELDVELNVDLTNK